jgi:hypothetical protein
LAWFLDVPGNAFHRDSTGRPDWLGVALDAAIAFCVSDVCASLRSTVATLILANWLATSAVSTTTPNVAKWVAVSIAFWAKICYNCCVT